MRGINIAEQCHVVNILAPRDVDTVATPKVFSLKNYSHASIILSLGVTGAACTVTVEECDNFTPTTHTPIPFSYYANTTAAGDTHGARTDVAAAGFATSLNDVIFYVIEIDAAQLDAGFPNLQLVLSDPAAVTFGCAIAILSGARYGGQVTAIV